jgi:uncharacterized membrane protein
MILILLYWKMVESGGVGRGVKESAVEHGRERAFMLLAMALGFAFAYVIPFILLAFGKGPIRPEMRTGGLLTLGFMVTNTLVLMNYVFLPATVTLIAARKMGVNPSSSRKSFWMIFTIMLVGVIMWAV